MSRNPYTREKQRARAAATAELPGRASDRAGDRVTDRAEDRSGDDLALGFAHHQAGRFREANRHYRKALARNAGNANALHLLGMAAFQSGQTEDAIGPIEAAIAIEPRDPAFHVNLGNVLQTLGRHEASAESYRRALALNPESPAAWSNLGEALRNLGQFDHAAASMEQALMLQPQLSVAHSNLGNLRLAQGRLEEAEICHRQALAADPGYLEAWCNLGTALELLGREDEAIEAYGRALVGTQNSPTAVTARFNRSMLRLLCGDFPAGWADYELRRRVTPDAGSLAEKLQWRGDPLEGTRILLHCEQGLGDTIQFLRYVPLVQKAGGEVMLLVQFQLRRVAGQLAGISDGNLFVPGETLPKFDWQCPLMSLPLAFQTAPATIPATTPYLNVPREAGAKAAHLAMPESGLRVGLAWAGSPEHKRNRYRSIPLAALEPLLGVSGVDFYSLQLGDAGREADGAERILSLEGWIDDMADTAALIERMDLVIAADTAVAHLAGALGKPVWMLTPAAPDWRWMLAREDSPWYPSMRLFRQAKLGDWTPVVRSVASALAAKAGEERDGCRG